MIQEAWNEDKTQVGISLHQKFALNSLRQMKEQNDENTSLWVALLQRALQAEQSFLTIPKSGQNISQQVIVEALANVAMNLSQHLPAHQKETLELLRELVISQRSEGDGGKVERLQPGESRECCCVNVEVICNTDFAEC